MNYSFCRFAIGWNNFGTVQYFMNNKSQNENFPYQFMVLINYFINISMFKTVTLWTFKSFHWKIKPFIFWTMYWIPLALEFRKHCYHFLFHPVVVAVFVLPLFLLSVFLALLPKVWNLLYVISLSVFWKEEIHGLILDKTRYDPMIQDKSSISLTLLMDYLSLQVFLKCQICFNSHVGSLFSALKIYKRWNKLHIAITNWWLC